MAKLIKANGTIEDVKDLSLENLQKIVGGYIQDVPLKDGVHLIMNDEGKFMGLPVNELATQMWERVYGKTDIVVGDVVTVNITEKGEYE